MQAIRGWIVVAVTVIIVSTVTGVVVISVFAPSSENIGQIVSLVVPTLAALSALLSSAINSRKLDESITKTEENITKTEEVHRVVSNGSGSTKR